MSLSEPGDILRQRARSLARPLARDTEIASADALDVLVVMVDGQRLAIPLDHVAAIARAASIVPLPRATAPVYGVTVWRGRPLTVLTLDVPSPGPGAESRFVVLGDSRRAEVAVLVDGVDDVMRIDRASINPMGAPRRAVSAIGVTDDAMVVLDVDALIRGHRNAAPASPIE